MWGTCQLKLPTWTVAISSPSCARRPSDKFLTLPRYLTRHGYVTAGNGKIFHPAACDDRYNNTHRNGDDVGAWSEPYFSEPECTQWASVPCPGGPADNGTMGVSYVESALSDDDQTDGQLARNAVARLAEFAARGVGRRPGKPFFHAVGLHKPHLPHIVPKKYFDLYPVDRVSLPPNRRVPVGFKEENWHADGNFEMEFFANNKRYFPDTGFGFEHPIDANRTRELRRGYFAATSFIDAQIGRVIDALDAHGFTDSTVVTLWSDHGWHLGDTNSWCKMTNFESATRNTMLWRVPGQPAQSQGRNPRLVEMIDWFPTVVDLAGLPPLPRCTGLDQPPGVECIQGTSYADEFSPRAAAVPLRYAFSQWPYPALSGMTAVLRMGYTVRSTDGYRLTLYVAYDRLERRGNWSTAADAELYDYTVDPWETRNRATDGAYTDVVARLSQVLRTQYTAGIGTGKGSTAA